LVTGVISNGTTLAGHPESLAVALSGSGYATAGFVSAFPLHDRYNWSQGFDVYDDDLWVFPQPLKGLAHVWLAQRLLYQWPGHERSGDVTVDRALDWLRSNHDEDFFVWIHLYEPHAPYQAPNHPFDPPTNGEPLQLPSHWPSAHQAITSTAWLTDAYHAEVQHTDTLRGRVFDELMELGVWESSVVVVVADHGESLTEHDYLFDHGDHLYDVSLRVPWIVKAPSVEPGATIDCQVSTLDVTPTILGLLEIDDGQTRYGVNRRSELDGRACRPSIVVSTTVGQRHVRTPRVDYAIRDGQHKLIAHGDMTDTQCFNIVTDPEETVNVQCPQTLRATLQTAMDSRADNVDPEDDGATQRALKALGYIDE